MVLIFSIGFGAFMFVFALTVQDGLHNDALRGGLYGYPHAFATVECIQMGIVVLLTLGAAILPRFTPASADAPVIDA